MTHICVVTCARRESNCDSIRFWFPEDNVGRWRDRTEICHDSGCRVRWSVLRESHSHLGKEATDYSATGLIKFIKGFFHKHMRLRCDGETATVALANKVKHTAGELVKLETTAKHSSPSNLAERAIQAVDEQTQTIRADCQMRFGNGEAFGADKPIWAWLLRQAGWQISRYKQKGSGMTAHKQAHGEHFTHEVVPFAEVILVRIPSSTCNVGTKVTLCLSRVFGLEGVRHCLHAWRSCAFANNSTVGTVSST